jgi:hypothetical protein
MKYTTMISNNHSHTKPSPAAPTKNDFFVNNHSFRSFLAGNFPLSARPQACDEHSSIKIRRASSTGREQSRRVKEPIKMQNKPNLNNSIFNLTYFITKTYAPMGTSCDAKNKPNFSQNKPNSNPNNPKKLTGQKCKHLAFVYNFVNMALLICRKEYYEG